MTQEDVTVGRQPVMINIKLLLSIVTVLIGGGMWVGVTVTGIRGDQKASNQQRLELVNKLEEVAKRERANAARIRNLETGAARTGAQYDALLSSVADIKQSVGQTNQLVQQLLRNNYQRDHNGSSMP